MCVRRCCLLLLAPAGLLLPKLAVLEPPHPCCNSRLAGPVPAAQAAAREEDLQQRLAVAELEVKKLTRALAAQRQRADEARQKLQALLP